MFAHNQIYKVAPILILLIAVDSIVPYSTVPFTNTFVSWFIQIVTLTVLWKSKITGTENKFKGEMGIVMVFLTWNIICIVRGLFAAESYWQWKSLVSNSLGILMPIIAYSATNSRLWQSILSVFMRYGLVLFLLIIPFILRGAYGFFLVPISFLALFLPILPLKRRILILIFSVVVIFADLGARSNVIRFGIPFVLLSIYYFKSILNTKALELGRKVLFIVPFLMFSLAVSGVFNVFKMDEYLDGEFVDKKVGQSGEVLEENLIADTRTFLFEEVLLTAAKYDSWMLGRTPARGNETQWFASEMEDMYGVNERFRNEAAILNVFTWTGLIGVVLYGLVFYKASYLAINRSRNTFSKILGVFISFRWIYAWVEDGNYFNLTHLFLWFIIGLAFSKEFRFISDGQIKAWIYGIFDERKSTLYKTK